MLCGKEKFDPEAVPGQEFYLLLELRDVLVRRLAKATQEARVCLAALEPSVGHGRESGG
jgi:hypothetical protein